MGLHPLEIACLYISAACHDYEHPGVNNTFLINSKCKIIINFLAPWAI